MKYAFILGSNAFITSNGAISYDFNGEIKEFIRINKTVKGLHGNAGSALDVSINIQNNDGTAITLTNGTLNVSGLRLDQATDRIKVLKQDGATIIDVHELSDDVISGLSHHVIAELESEGPLAVIRLFGHFKLGNTHISIDNEKLFIDQNSYAESVHVEHHQGGIVFTAEGVLM